MTANGNIGIKGWRNYSSFSLFAAGSARADKNTAMLVDTASGNLSVVSTDWVLAGRVPCPVTRSYNHLDDTSGVDRPFGPGWYWQYDMNITGGLDGTSASTWKAADGSEYEFTSPSGAGNEKTYTSPAGMHQYTLTFDATRTNEFELTAGKLTYAFKVNSDDSRARLMYIRDAFGNGIELSRPVDGNSDPEATISYIQIRYYDVSATSWTTQNIIQPTYSSGLITQLRLLDTEDSGDYLDLVYSYDTIDSEDRLILVQPKFGGTSINMEVAYDYDSSAGLELTKVYDTEGYQAGTQWYWTVTYSSDQVATVVFPVASGTTGTVSYTYDTSAPASWSHASPDTWNKVTDALSNDWYYGQDSSGRVEFAVDPLWVNSSHESYTEYAYNTDHQVTEVKVPRPNEESGQNSTKYYYNSHKNLAAVVDAYGFVSWYKYGSRASYAAAGTGATVNDVIGIFTPAPGQAAYDDSDHTDSETTAPSLSSPLDVDTYVDYDDNVEDQWGYEDGASNGVALARTVIDYEYTTGTAKLEKLRSCSPANFAETSAESYTLTTLSGASQQEFDEDTGDLLKSYTPRQFQDSSTYKWTAYTHDEVYGVVTAVEQADSVLASASKSTNYTYNGLRTRVTKVELPESVSDSQWTESLYNDNEFLIGTKRPDIGSWSVDPQLNINEYDYNGNLEKVWQADPAATGTRWDGNSANGYDEVRGASYDRINRAISSYVKVDWNQDSTVETLTTYMTYDANGNVIRVKGPAYTAMDTSTKYTYNFTDYDELGRVEFVYTTTADTSADYNTKPSTFTQYFYDLAGNVSEVRDPLYDGTKGKELYHAAFYTYDELNRRIKTLGYYAKDSKPAAISTEQHFDASGGVYWSEDGEGYKTYPERDLSGRLVAVHRGTDTGDADLREYDADSHLEYYYSYEDVDSGTPPIYRTRNKYDELGRLVNSGRERYVTSSWQDWNSNTADATFNYNGWAVKTYDKVNTGKYTEREYDNWGQLTVVNAPEVPNPAGAGNVIYEAEYTYNVLGQRTQADDHEDNSTYFYYDLLGRQIKVKDALNYETKTYYDARSLRWKVVRPSDAYTVFEYGDAKRLASQTVYHDSTSEETAYTSNLLGQVTQVDYPDGGINKFEYDELGRRVLSQTLLSGTTYLDTEYTYDDNNKMTLLSAPGGYEYEYEYDDLGNLTSSTDPASEETEYTYDLDNRQLTKTDPVGVVATNAYDWKTGRVSSVVTEINATSGDDITVSYAYDANGRPTTITDGRGYDWTKAYDAMGRMVTLTTPNPGSGAYTHTIVHDGNGNMIKTTDFKSTSHYYAYDALNRMSGHGTDSGADDETYTYACCGAQLSAYTDDLGTASLSYDELGRLTSFTDTNGNQVQYTYDEMGRILTLTPDQGTNYRTVYTYNANGSVDTVTVYDAGTGAETSYIYEETSGKLRHRNFPEESSQYIHTAYSYDTAGRLQYETLTREGGGTTNLSRTGYAYSVSSYHRQVVRTEQTYSGGWNDSFRITYKHDGLGRLDCEQGENYDSGWEAAYQQDQSYDKNGNRTGFTREIEEGQEDNFGQSMDLSYAFNNVNALTEIVDNNAEFYTCEVTCDANNNITQVVETETGEEEKTATLTTSFSYDALNRLTAHQEARYDSTAGATQYRRRYHKYDGLGRAVQSALQDYQAGDPDPGPPTYREHIYAGARHVQNSDGSSTYGARWHWAGAAQEHASPLKSPNADTSGNTGYNVANTTAPQRRTYLSPTSEGNERHLYGQGKPNAMDADAETMAAQWSTGIVSEDSTGEVQVESRLFYQGTVEGGGTANELSRLTDAREKGRIGILGSALSYAGSYGRVTSESIGRDLNPLGRGDGGSYVAGGMNLGRISPSLPGNKSPGGWGNSVNNSSRSKFSPCDRVPVGSRELTATERTCVLDWQADVQSFIGPVMCPYLPCVYVSECDFCDRDEWIEEPECCMQLHCNCKDSAYTGCVENYCSTNPLCCPDCRCDTTDNNTCIQKYSNMNPYSSTSRNSSLDTSLSSSSMCQTSKAYPGKSTASHSGFSINSLFSNLWNSAVRCACGPCRSQCHGNLWSVLYFILSFIVSAVLYSIALTLKNAQLFVIMALINCILGVLSWSWAGCAGCIVACMMGIWNPAVVGLVLGTAYSIGQCVALVAYWCYLHPELCKGFIPITVI